MDKLKSQTKTLLQLLGHDEEPLGVFYSDTKPDGPGPQEATPLSAEAEKRGEIDFQVVFRNFSCVMARVLLSRSKKITTWVSAEAYGCPGAAHFAGFFKPALEFGVHNISTGIPGVREGQLTLPSVESARLFYMRVDVPPAPKPYCVIQPLSLFKEGEEPEVIVYFARGELLGALCALTSFTTGEPESVVAPFGAGCTNITAWPRHYREIGLQRAVLGGNDMTCRSFYKLDEMSFAVTTDLYRKMLEAAPDSFLKTEMWEKVKKRIIESNVKAGKVSDI